MWCDVCNNPFLKEVLTGESVPSFKLSCSPSLLHAHEKCLKTLEKASASEDESLLPEGPVKTLFRKVKEHNAKLEERQP